MNIAPATPREVLVIDAGIADWHTLVANLNPDIAVILLPAGGNGLDALALALAEFGTIDALHLVSHGASGQLHLGELRLNAANLGGQSEALAQIASHLTPDSDLLLYGCSVAQGATGQAFIGALSDALHGVDIAASIDATGAGALGGNWELEYRAGHIETGLPFAQEDIVHYNAATFVDDFTAHVNSIDVNTFAPTKATSVIYQVIFSADVYNVDAADFVLTAASGNVAGTISSVTGGGNVYQVTVTGITGDGVLRLDLKAGTNIVDINASPVDPFTSGSVYTIDHTAPTVGSVGAPANGAYMAGQNLDFTVNFSEAVTVGTGGGTPWIGLTLNTGGTVHANYISGSGTTGLTFRYTLASGNADSDGVSLASSIVSNGGTLRDGAGNDATLALNGVPTLTGVLVGGAAPSVSSIDRVGSATSNATSVAYTVTFSSSVTGVDASDFALSETGSASGSIASVSGSGASYTVTVNGITGDGTLRLDLNSSGTGIAAAGTAIATGFTSGQAYTVDHTAPAAPSAPDMASASDSGVSSLDNITSAATPTFTGTAETGATVTLYDTDGTTVLGTGVATSGNWSIASSTLSSGSHTITAKVTDAAGNTSAASTGLAVTIDTSAPAVAITSNASALKAGETATITFTFSEDPGASFSWNGSAGDLVVTGGTLGAISGTGLTRTATFTPAAGTDGGTASITIGSASYTDAAGNAGGAGATPSLSFDTLAPSSPSAPDMASASDSGVSSLDNLTSDAAPTFTGTAEAGATVTLYDTDGTTVLGTGTATSGNWSIASSTLSSGAHTITAKVTDAGGNTSAASTGLAVMIDTSAPTVAITSNVSALKVGETATITFTFSEDPGASFSWDGSAGDVSVTGGTLSAISGSGLTRTATFTPAAAANGGIASITVGSASYTDAAGNSGVAGATPSLSFDTLAPAAPTALDMGSVSDDGNSSTDDITRVTAPTFAGSAESGATVTLYDTDGTTVLGTGTATGGAWSITSTALGVGNHTLTAKAVDAAGNMSAASTGLGVVIVGPNNAPTGAVNISGAATEGTTLTAASTLADTDGLGPISYQWKTGGTNITGATASSFTLTAAQVGAVISVTASYLDGHGTNEAVTSAPTGSVGSFVAPAPPVVTATIDGVPVSTQATPNPVTGLNDVTVSVPIITGTRTEDPASAHPGLADIPFHVASSAGTLSADLVVSLPVGAGLQGSGAATLLSAPVALLDLIDRMDGQTTNGSPAEANLEAHAADFINALPAGTGLAIKTLAPVVAPGAVLNQPIIVSGSSSTPAQGAPANATAIGLVIDATHLPSNVVLQLDNVDFAAVIGQATLRGGEGRNYVVGDDSAQNIVLGADDDILFGGGGNDIIGSAGGNDILDGGTGDDIVFGGIGNDSVAGGAGNDVLQGGRSDQGQWNFFLDAQGHVVGMHNTALVNPAAMEKVSAAELDLSVARLGFASADQGTLASLALLYDAAFNRAPDLAGLSFWAAQHGADASQFTRFFMQSGEWANGLGKLSNADFVDQLYVNALGHAGSASQTAAALAQLNGAADNVAARAQLFQAVALGDEHRAAAPTASGIALGGELLMQEQGWILGSGDDRLDGGAGSDLLIGGDGVDTVVYAGLRAQYQLRLTAGGDIIVADLANHDVDTLHQVEQVQFSDGAVNIGFTQAAPALLQQVGLLYQAVLGRAADIGGINFWAAHPLDTAAMAKGFIDSAEFRARGALDDAAFVRVIQENALHHAPDAASVQTWTTYLETHTRAELVTAYAASVEVVGAQYGTQGLWLA